MSTLDSVLRKSDDLHDWWESLSEKDRPAAFEDLHPAEASTLFLDLERSDRAMLVADQPAAVQQIWLRLLPPDDAADVIQAFPPEDQARLVGLLDATARSQVQALLAYQEDVAGGLMNPRYVRIPPEMTAEQAVRYLRLQARSSQEVIYYAYVLDRQDHLLGVVSYRDLLLAAPETAITEIMERDVTVVPEDMDQEEVARVLRRRALFAVPVVSEDGRLRGIVTADDLAEVERAEATEDIQKLGGLEALEEPYFRTRPTTMLRKRGGWLAVLFLGQMITITAMGFFEDELRSAVALALYVPLIISTGGNSGSQAATLVIRAMALGEVRARDFWAVLRREASLGLALGLMLALLGTLRIFTVEGIFGTYGEDLVLLGLTIGLSVTVVVTWGTITGSTLPFILSRTGFDPASASAPLVATVMDVTGLIIYLSIARVILL